MAIYYSFTAVLFCSTPQPGERELSARFYATTFSRKSCMNVRFFERKKLKNLTRQLIVENPYTVIQ
jgi:hypothetical protein